MSSTPVCEWCKEPIGNIGEYTFVTCAGSVFHHNCFRKAKEFL